MNGAVLDTDSTTLITGATQGIGAAIARRFALAGAKLAINDRVASPAMDAMVKEVGGVVAPADVSDRAQVNRMVSSLVETSGPIGTLICNAAYMTMAPFTEHPIDDWWKVVDTNLTGAFLMTQAVMGSMLKARWGRIINITSVVGQTGQAGQANYAASKAGLIGLTRSLARELASRTITVNAVAPGYIETAMTAVLTEAQRTAMTSQIPLARAGTDRDIAAAVAFLASEEAGYITGHTLDVNGGMYMG